MPNPFFDPTQAVKIIKRAMSNMQEQMNQAAKNLAEVAKDLPENTNIAQEFLAKRGWFIPFRNLPLARIKWIAECVKEKRSYNQIDEYLTEYIENSIPGIIKDSEQYFDERFKILEEAFQAHKEERYALSIPTLLSQADGIFRDLFGKDFYKNDPDERNEISKRILKKLNQNEHRVTAASLSYVFIKQLHEESSLHEPYSETNIFEDGEDIETLNRHEVLHGIAKKYDTKINSTKAIGLIGLLVSAKRTLIKKGAV